MDSGAIDLDAHRSFLIGRILSAGPLESIRWARQTYGDDVIREWIVVHEGRQLSSPQIRLLETLIGLPAEAVAAWLAVPERRIWEGRVTPPSQDSADAALNQENGQTRGEE